MTHFLSVAGTPKYPFKDHLQPRLQLRCRHLLEPCLCRRQQLLVAVHAQVVQPRTWRGVVGWFPNVVLSPCGSLGIHIEINIIYI